MSASIERLRVTGLCVCLLLVFARVVAQLEVALLQPAWLPPMHAWYSGLIPYAVLPPLQIAILLLMALVVYDHARGYGLFWPERQATRVVLAWIAGLYAAAMGVRLIVSAAISDGGLIEAGIIPVAFHWVLAGFIALISAAPANGPDRSAVASTKALTRERPVPRLPFLGDIARASESETSGSDTADEHGRERYSEVPIEDLVRIRRRSL